MTAKKEDIEDYDIGDTDEGIDDDSDGIHSVGEVSVGGGPSKAINIAILALCLFGIVYGLIAYLTARGD